MDNPAVGDADGTGNVIAAIDRVQMDVEKVEFWACAFSGLIAPVAGYDQDRAVRLPRRG